VLFRHETLEGIAGGRIRLAFRRWTRRRVRPGTRLRTSIGLIEVVDVAQVTPDAISEADARVAGETSRASLLEWLGAGREGDYYRIELRPAGPDPRVALRDSADLDAAAHEDISRRLSRMDAASSSGPWTLAVLLAIEAAPAVRAADIAGPLGMERLHFKANVRKLKELGLTESLGTGYRLSPRGRAYLDSRDLDRDQVCGFGVQ
jgi:hypothetical protein